MEILIILSPIEPLNHQIIKLFILLSNLFSNAEKCFNKAIVNEPIDKILSNIDKCMDEHWTERAK